jgi:hypothetical protein
MKTSGEAASIQAAIQKRSAICFVNHNWDITSLDVVRLSMLELERGLDRITKNRGRDWIKRNLGGVRILLGCDHSILGSGIGSILRITFIQPPGIKNPA